MAKLTEEELLFRKVEEKVKKAIFEYGLIVDGDRILIGLSGGEKIRWRWWTCSDAVPRYSGLGSR